MATVVSAADIPPGGEGKIDVKVSTRGRKGKLSKSVTVESNDPKNPRYMLKVFGNVEVLAGFEPQRLDLKHVHMGETVVKTARIVAKDAKNLKVTELTSSRPEDVTAEMVEEDGQPAVKVTFKASDKPGRISARVTAKTNLEKVPQIQLYVFGQVTADLITNRSYVFFPSQVEEQPKDVLRHTIATLAAPLIEKNRVVRVEVSSLGGKPFRITGVNDPKGAVIGAAQQDGDKWLVHMMLVAKPKSPRGIVQLKTDRDDQPSIDVRYGARTARSPGLRPAGKPGLRAPGAQGRPLVKPVRIAPGEGKAQGGKRLRLAPNMRKLPIKAGSGGKPVRLKPVKPKLKPVQPQK